MPLRVAPDYASNGVGRRRGLGRLVITIFCRNADLLPMNAPTRRRRCVSEASIQSPFKEEVRRRRPSLPGQRDAPLQVSNRGRHLNIGGVGHAAAVRSQRCACRGSARPTTHRAARSVPRESCVDQIPSACGSDQDVEFMSGLDEQRQSHCNTELDDLGLNGARLDAASFRGWGCRRTRKTAEVTWRATSGAAFKWIASTTARIKSHSSKFESCQSARRRGPPMLLARANVVSEIGGKCWLLARFEHSRPRSNASGVRM